MSEVSNLYKTSSLGYDLVFRGPSTEEEYNSKAGTRESGRSAVLEDAVENEIYRGTLPEFQDKFADEILRITGIARAENTAATEKARARAKSPEAAEKVKPVLETVKTYHSRVLAQVGDDVKAQLKAAAQAVADSIEIDPSAAERKGGVKKAYLDKAKSIIESGEAEAKIAKWRDAFDLDDVERDDAGNPTLASLARMVEAVIAKM